MDEKKSMILYLNAIEQWNMLTNEQAGALIKALLLYGSTGETIDFEDGMLRMAFSFMTAQMDRDREKWEQVRERRREAGKLGGRPKKQTEQEKANETEESNEKQKKQMLFEKAKKAVNVNVNGNVNGNVIDNNTADKPQQIDNEIQSVVDAYHTICIDLPKIRTLTKQRRSAVKARISESGIDTITEAFRKAQASDFLTGKKSDFTASFDWIMKPSNFCKILEGNYDNRQASPAPVSSNQQLQRPQQPQQQHQQGGSIDWDDVYKLVNNFGV